MAASNRTVKPWVGMPMEGRVARRYARQRATPEQLALVRRHAGELTAGLPDGAAVLEVAPGPGYLAIEMARSGRLDVTGVDVSATFVELASAAASAEGVRVEFLRGDAAELPVDDGRFDLVVCQAAFKNFSRPAAALAEFHRALRPGGTAVIHDMRREATWAEIAAEVGDMGLARPEAVATALILRWLRRRASTVRGFEERVSASPFGSCTTTVAGIGVEVRMARPVPEAVPRSSIE